MAHNVHLNAHATFFAIPTQYFSNSPSHSSPTISITKFRIFISLMSVPTQLLMPSENPYLGGFQKILSLHCVNS